MDTLAEHLASYFESLGIDAMHGATILCILFMVGYCRDIKNWEDIRLSAKFLIITGAIVTVVFSVVSILRLVGVIDL